MKTLIAGLFLLTGFTTLSQSNNYFISLDGDTTFCEIKKKGPSKIIATVNGKKTKYSAKEIKGYNQGGANVSAYVNMPARYGAKGWTFLQPLVSGEMNLYVVYTTRVTTDPSTRMQTSTTFSSFYAKKSSEDEYILLTVGWRKKLAELGAECGAFLEKLETAAKEDYEESFLIELFKLYNSCPN